ncbi:MAG: Na-translocating system protein MpsC family protein, partial [Actinobacteria bacterium]|nr:Na-translocating system protein MpsC family protein [Actinomycetota bacterium]
MAGTTEDRPSPTGGSLAAAISRATVRIMADYTGRGPTKARASIRDDVVLVLLQDTRTKGERTLVAGGEAQFVMDARRRFQMTMQEDLVAAVEMLAERKVIAFMSANRVEPDMGAEVFVLEPGSAREAPEIEHDGLTPIIAQRLSPPPLRRGRAAFSHRGRPGRHLLEVPVGRPANPGTGARGKGGDPAGGRRARVVSRVGRPGGGPARTRRATCRAS